MIRRLYQDRPFTVGEQLTLSHDAAHHVRDVLRMQVNDPLILFSGDNQEYTATITESHKKAVIVRIDHQHHQNRESPRGIYLAQGISKGERMSFVVQKAVELGVTGIIPLWTDHAVVRLDEARTEKKRHHWQSIVIAACEQSGRNWIPTVYPPCSFDTFIHTCQQPLRWILDPQAGCTWREYSITPGDMALLVGPEGGLSSRENTLAQEKGFKPLRLGPRILRTETAALAAISVLQAVAGDL